MIRPLTPAEWLVSATVASICTLTGLVFVVYGLFLLVF
jgi:hypothetical protein